ncbi:Splicing factor 3B subunit 1 [Dichanthelium oligosanthes]|uniref:Splicing factor 3B subunit 1 n=1 Tax=Dichanthelium oligosanthes TaxID=888268 RepID=A0A1E5VXE4_9POAL|nr:Splicing factor 3B subunit 1 [Dichanthelium oligosanthes]
MDKKRKEEEEEKEKQRKAASEQPAIATAKRRNRWDQSQNGDAAAGAKKAKTSSSDWDAADPAPGIGHWDATPGRVGDGTPSVRRNRWDETPTPGRMTDVDAIPPAGGSTPSVAWDATPKLPGEFATPMPKKQRSRWDETPNMGSATPGSIGAATHQRYFLARYERDIEERNRPLTDEDLDSMLPQNRGQQFDVPKELLGGLPLMKPEDYQYFGTLLNEEGEEQLSPEKQKERKIMKLLLKVKNGTPQQLKAALRQLTEKAREFGAGPLFNKILPLLMQPTLEDQERHLLVKIIDRVLYKLDELVRPFVHKILVVIEPLLIDEDYYARVEGREIISNHNKAAARAFSVVASALGIPALLPFLKAVCQRKKSWQARRTGIKVVQQIAILMGCAVLPHLKSLVEIIEHGLTDENQKVWTITALSLAALAEAAAPYGIKSFDTVLRPLWKGIKSHRGKVLAAFLKAIGFIIPLMDAGYASYYTKGVMEVLIREFQSPDEEMKKIVLKVVKQCVSTEGVEADYIRNDILPNFFSHFRVRRMALDRRNSNLETTVEMANKIGVANIVGRIVEDLKDESEPYRRMVMETIEKVVANLGVSDVDARLEELLIDGILYAFQEQTSDDANVMLNGFGVVVNALGQRVKPYLRFVVPSSGG